MRLCVCVCVCERGERERESQTIWDSGHDDVKSISNRLHQFLVGTHYFGDHTHIPIITLTVTIEVMDQNWLVCDPYLLKKSAEHNVSREGIEYKSWT